MYIYQCIGMCKYLAVYMYVGANHSVMESRLNFQAIVHEIDIQLVPHCCQFMPN